MIRKVVVITSLSVSIAVNEFRHIHACVFVYLQVTSNDDGQTDLSWEKQDLKVI